MAAAVDIPGVATRAILGVALNAAMQYSSPQNKVKIIEASTIALKKGVPIMEGGRHIGYEFSNIATEAREMYDLDGNLLVAIPENYIRDMITGFFGKAAVSLGAVAGAIAGLLGLNPNDPVIIEKTYPNDALFQNIASQGSSGSLLTMSPMIGSQQAPALMQPGITTPYPVEAEPAEAEQETRAPPPAYGPKIPTGRAYTPPAGGQYVPPAGGEVPFGQSLGGAGAGAGGGAGAGAGGGELTPAQKAALLANANMNKMVQAQDRAYNRYDQMQTRTATQRIANLEVPLYDYSQESVRLRGLLPADRPVII
jgi:hypothetical protein